MKAGIRNLTNSNVPLPSEIIIDTNVLITHFLGSFLPPQNSRQVQRAAWLFGQLVDNNAMGFVTDAAVGELLHKLITAKFLQDIPNHQQVLAGRAQGRKLRWEDLYKARPSLLKRYADDLTRLMAQLTAFGLFLLQPGDLADVAPAEWEDELVRYIKRYQVDVNDARILLDAKRAGIMNIVTFDADLIRAQSDFRVYTWR